MYTPAGLNDIITMATVITAVHLLMELPHVGYEVRSYGNFLNFYYMIIFIIEQTLNKAHSSLIVARKWKRTCMNLYNIFINS